MMPFLVLAAAYLIGGIPFGYLLVKLKSGADVRSMGSGNIGATNVLRTTGRALGFLTLFLDILKGAFAVWLADELLQGSPFWMSLAALSVMAGHAYPVFLKFRGGKAVASFIGAFFYLTPVPLLTILVVFGVTVAFTRFISLGSVLAAAFYPAAVFLIEHPPPIVVLSAAIAGGFIVWRHKENLKRIRDGNENVFSLGGRKR
jgi:acyl phosphate:glycerol-3-phosphate acyltransferase